MPQSQSLPGPIFSEPFFNEGKLLPDPKGFQVPHPSDNATYTKLGNLLFTQTTAIPTSTIAADGLYGLDQVYGAKGSVVLDQIKQAGRITFHMVGDTGASNVGKYPSELRAADKMVADFQVSDPTLRPSFFYHLGDLVYDFGEPKYYYDEFYEPYRNYPRPILAIPGNHDSFTLPGTPAGQAPLDIFQRNFCATQPEVTSEAYSLHRTAMTQPGVYFTLDAPFVRIIGLFSNALEDPGVISSENGQWANVSEVQLDFLRAQLQRVATERYTGAVLLAMHHPPFVYQAGGGSASSDHGSSLNMLRDIDTVCSSVGVYPHAVLSGHAHNYQRFTRKITLGGRTIEVPFVVCGNGGHGVNPIVSAPQAHPAKGADVSFIDAKPALPSQGLILENFDDQNYGYLLLTVDGSHLNIAYNSTGAGSSPADQVTIGLAGQNLAAK